MYLVGLWHLKSKSSRPTQLMKRSRDDDGDDDVHEDVTAPEKKTKKGPDHVRIGVLTDNPSVFKGVSEQTMTKEDVDIFREDTGLELAGPTFEFFLLDGRTAASRFYILRDTLLGGPGAAVDLLMLDSDIDIKFHPPLHNVEEDLELFLQQFIDQGAPWIHLLTYLHENRAWKEKQFWFVTSEYQLDATLFTKGDAGSFSLPPYISDATLNHPWPRLMVLGEVTIGFQWLFEVNDTELVNWIKNGLIEHVGSENKKGKKQDGDSKMNTLSDLVNKLGSAKKARALAAKNYKWTPKALAIIRKSSLGLLYRAVFKALVFKDAMRQPPIAKTTRRPDGHRVRESPLSKESEKLVLQYLGGKAKEVPHQKQKKKKKKKQPKLLLVDSSSSDSD
jgi:hypothetical protein